MPMNEVAEQFEKKVDGLVEELQHLPLEDRIAKIDEVCEKYVMEHGRKPDSYQLQRLSNLILLEDLTNPDVYKVQREEFPFLSDSQTRRRKRREFVAKDSTLAFMDFKVSENLSTSPPTDNRP